MRKELASLHRIKKGGKKEFRKKMRHISIRKKIVGCADAYRLCVTKSRRNLFVQIIDDTKGVTLFSVHSYKIQGNKNKKSEEVAACLLKELNNRGISKVVFDRGGNLYSQRIKPIGDKMLEANLL